MLTITDITTAVYRLLAAEPELAAACTVYRGRRRPTGAANPALTVEADRLAPGAGRGMWTCEIAVAAYADALANGMPDRTVLDTLTARARAVLENAEPALATDARVMPVSWSGTRAPAWSAEHEREYAQETVFGLTFVQFV